MSHAELLAAYPTVGHAVTWVELFLCGGPAGSDATGWDVLMGRRPLLSPPEVAGYIRTVADGESVGRAAEARAEMDRPEFVLYIAGRMGAL